MSQLTNLISESRTLSKDTSTWQMRNWYVELIFFFMPPNTSKWRRGWDRRNDERMWHTKPYSNMPRSMRWWWKTSTITSQMEESHNPQQLMWSKHLNAVRKAQEPAAHIGLVVWVVKTAKCVASPTQCTHTKTVQHLAKNATNTVLRIISVLAADRLRAAAKAKTNAEVEHQLKAEAQRDITNPTEADTPGPDHIQEVDHKLATLTA